MNWEKDPDSWKNEDDVKPWEAPDGWKLESGYTPGETEEKKNPHIFRRWEVTAGIQPTVDVIHVEESTEQLSVKDRDALKLVSHIAHLQKALTDEGELFQYSEDRNMWIKIPWELL